MKQELAGYQEAIGASVATAKAAQNLDVTQDVMKQAIQMQATETMLLGAVAASSQQQRQDNAWGNLNLRNISRSLDQANRDRRLDRSAAAHKLLSTTAQLRLF